MIGVPGLQRPGTKHLFGEQHPRQAVWQCQLRQGPREIRTLPTIVGNTIGTTDDETQVPAIRLPIFEPGCEQLARQLLALLVEENNLLCRAEPGKYLLSFARHRSTRLVVLPASDGCDGIKTKLPLAGEPFGINAEGLVHPGRLAVTNGE